MRTTDKMGLTSWDQPTDNYNYAQLAGNWQLLDYHDHSPSRGVPVAPGGLATGAVLAGSIAAGVVGSQHLTSTLIQDLGIGSTGRGAISIATAQTTTSTTAAWLATPDQVTGIVLDSNGLIDINYVALWEVASGTGTAYLTLNGTTVQTAGVNDAFTAATATTTATHLSPLSTNGTGLTTTASTAANSTEVTTGQIAGQGVSIFAAAGTYTVGIQFSNSAGAVTTVSNRHLFVQTVNFA